MSMLRKGKGWQWREIDATIGAALHLLEEFERSGPSTLNKGVELLSRGLPNARKIVFGECKWFDNVLS
jgi:hypothetical protein